MTANHLVDLFLIAFCVLLCNAISKGQTSECRSDADCSGSNDECCMVNKTDNRRACVLTCLNQYCSIESDCGKPSRCCRSRRCIQSGCSGCRSLLECGGNLVCCRKTHPLNETLCASNCINQSCNSNNDCYQWKECCRSRKCVAKSTGQCLEQCTSRFDCDSDQYCCKREDNGFPDNGCRYTRCLGEICRSDKDCRGPSECCRSNICISRGCSGCTEDSDCSVYHGCCKKTFPLNETYCGLNCLNASCNSKDDCGIRECCRSGKCVSYPDGYGGCGQCTTTSNCNLGQYCCRDPRYAFCNEDCVGMICSSNEDCGGPNECCISNECVNKGCHGCNSSADCSSGHVCCKKKEWYELNECGADCLGKSCGTDDDCGGPGEKCDSENRCTIKSLPSWVIPVIAVSLVVCLVAVGAFVAVFWYSRRARARNSTEANCETLTLENPQYMRGHVGQNPPPKTANRGAENPGFPNPSKNRQN